MKFTYLFLVLLIFILPLVAGKLYRKTLWLDWKKYLRSAIIPILLFTVWDILVTNYFWFFNSRYVIGVYLFNLPIEEILFFFIIPYSCLFLWINFDKKITDIEINIFRWIFFLITFPITVIFLQKDFYYSFIVGLLLIVTVIFDHVQRTYLFTKLKFYLFLLLVLLLITIFNGILTGLPVITYASSVKTNLNVFTIPIEDYGYGVVLVSLITILYQKSFSKKEENLL